MKRMRSGGTSRSRTDQAQDPPEGEQGQSPLLFRGPFPRGLNSASEGLTQERAHPVQCVLPAQQV